MTEVNKSRVECFNTEITETISDMSELASEDEEINASKEQMEPKIFSQLLTRVKRLKKILQITFQKWNLPSASCPVRNLRKPA
jgi:hypothetical protein